MAPKRNIRQYLSIIVRNVLFSFFFIFVFIISSISRIANFLSSFFGARIDDNNSILILANERVGDVVLQIPAILAIINHFSCSKIILAVEEKCKSLVPLNRENVSIYSYKKERGLKNIISLFLISNDLRKNRFNRIFSFNNKLWSALLAYLVGGKIRIGINSQHSGFLLTVPIMDRRDIHEINRNLLFLEKQGIDTEKLRQYGSIKIEENARKAANEFLISHGVNSGDVLIAINPFSRQGYSWPYKKWSLLIDQLMQKENRKIVMIGDTGAIKIASLISNFTKSNPIMAVGKTTLSELGGLLSRCSLLITPDSAPMHIACACKTPVIALFGPTNHNRWGPFGDGRVILRKDLSCSPCAPYHCRKKSCLESIANEEVLEATELLLGNSKKIAACAASL